MPYSIERMLFRTDARYDCAVRSPYEYTILPCSTTTIALDDMREMSAWTESRPDLLQPMRVGSATRCQVSPGKTRTTLGACREGCAVWAAALIEAPPAAMKPMKATSAA